VPQRTGTATRKPRRLLRKGPEAVRRPADVRITAPAAATASSSAMSSGAAPRRRCLDFVAAQGGPIAMARGGLAILFLSS
jgi:hypothetical protein